MIYLDMNTNLGKPIYALDFVLNNNSRLKGGTIHGI